MFQDVIFKSLIKELGGTMYTVRDEIIKYLINEKKIASRKDVKFMSYKQLLAKYKACIQN